MNLAIPLELSNIDNDQAIHGSRFELRLSLGSAQPQRIMINIPFLTREFVEYMFFLPLRPPPYPFLFVFFEP